MDLVRRPRAVMRAQRRIAKFKARIAIAALLLSAGTVAATTVPVSAVGNIAQGSVTLAGNGSFASALCGLPCSTSFPALTSGYVTGLDANGAPFTLSWGGLPTGSPVAGQGTLTMQNACDLGAIPDIQYLAAAVTVTTGVLVYGGASMNVTVNASFKTQVVSGDPTTQEITNVDFVATVGSTQVLNFGTRANGVLNYIPLSPLTDNICPLSGPVSFTTDGTEASVG